ncbi:hypothetical protein JRO89_XS04G0119200 [Xanthoceras sorbifolium]|uniref:Uncharacterized protein n=1 Tax=Xanthoceras sorbifolium TaxID=99658 RepID=A0ABQ8I549_9ROSI|nr:hypothetical protein JRO89_XS04G0119200 [Xanthoceras sorbifolium]
MSRPGSTQMRLRLRLMIRVSLRNYGTARGRNQRGKHDAYRDANPTIHQLAQEANPRMNLVAKLLEQQNRSLANMNRGGNAHRRKRNAKGQGNVVDGGICFLDGLHPYIQSRVEVLKLGRYADIIDQALIASRSMKEFKKAREAYRNINFRGGSSNGNASKQGSQFRKCGGHDGSEKVFGDVSFMKNAPPCQHCGCSHVGEFFRKTRACFSCGKIDHMIKDFPKRHFSPDNASTDDKKKSQNSKDVFLPSQSRMQMQQMMSYQVS